MRLGGPSGFGSCDRLDRQGQARLGQTASEFAQGIGVSRRAVQGWVRRYNQDGLAGLETRSGQGREPILSEDERQLVAQRAGAGPQAGEVCSLRGIDFQKFLETQFGKLTSLTSVYRVLQELGYEWLVPRPKHRKSDPEAIAAFKKGFRRAMTPVGKLVFFGK